MTTKTSGIWQRWLVVGSLVWLTTVVSGCANITPGVTVPVPGAADVKLTGHYYKDKYYFFPNGRNFERESLFLSALKEGAEGELSKPNWRFSAEQNLAIEYDALSFVVKTSSKVQWEYGIVLGKIGRWKEAADAFRTFVETNPTSAGTWGNLGVAEHAPDHYQESVVAFEKAAAIDPAYFGKRETQQKIWQASRERRPALP